MLEEKISKHLKIPYVELERNGKKYYLCNNGVIFADSEYMDFADLNAEYERRAKEDKLYDYNYAKSTGLLRKKRGLAKMERAGNETEKTIENQKGQELETSARVGHEDKSTVSEVRLYEHERLQDNRDNEGNDSERNIDEDLQGSISEARFSRAKEVRRKDLSGRWLDSGADKPEAKGKSRNIFLIILILTFASVCSMYESTLHTATYLFDYVDMISAWLLSTAVTAYNSSAFEVSVMFHTMKRNFMAFIFMLLWAMVTLFSMATTVSVFYDRFNFNETQIAQENKAVDSNKI